MAEKLRGLFVTENDLAPPGWVEIQREDDPEDEDLDGPIYDSDAEAAIAVAEAAGAVGTACLYEVGSGEMFQVYVLELAGYPAQERNQAIRWSADTEWIVVVPAVVARAAGLEVP